MNENQQLLQALNYIPADIQSAQDYESLARRFISPATYEYIAGGSGRDQTRAHNLTAFGAYSVFPRILCDLTHGHTRLHLLGREFSHPIFLAPVAYQKLVHAQGELETARGADAIDTCLISSTLSNHSMEDIAKTGRAEKWFQLYFQPTRTTTLDLIRRAEAAGYTAIVVTLDATVRSPSLGALRAQFQMPADCIAVNLQGYEDSPAKEIAYGQSRVFHGVMQDAPNWNDLEWLLNQTKLPVIAKGVLHSDDALKIKQIGCAGVVVSNHGGRGLDGAPASLDCLARIRAVVGETYPVLFDSGIRSGLDIFKAIALGADAVLIGRLQIYALSVAGALGVAHMLRLLREELELCMAQVGCATLDDIKSTKLELL
jgi:4-hydroxymandelate oxidase